MILLDPWTSLFSEKTGRVAEIELAKEHYSYFHSYFLEHKVTNSYLLGRLSFARTGWPDQSSASKENSAFNHDFPARSAYY